MTEKEQTAEQEAYEGYNLLQRQDEAVAIERERIKDLEAKLREVFTICDSVKLHDASKVDRIHEMLEDEFGGKR